MKRPSGSVVALALAAAALAGCSQEKAPRMLAEVYADTIGIKEDRRTPVVVIPGILGSKLYDAQSDTLVWGAFAGRFANPEKPEGARLLSHPIGLGQPLSELTDGVRPDGALDRIRADVLFLTIELDAYVDILETLGVGGYRDDQLGRAGAIPYPEGHYTCFQFDYDWRRDIADAADLLGQFIEESAAYAAEQRGADGPVKVDIVAHSMGGLVARYYLRYGRQPLPEDGSLPELTWAGADYVGRVVIVGTPNFGSSVSLDQLTDGFRLPFLPSFSPQILGTMPAIYQLLPRTRHGVYTNADTGETIDRIFETDYWIERGWGLADHSERGMKQIRRLLPDAADDEERKRIALDHLDKCLRRAEQFHRAMDLEAEPPRGLELKLVAGDAEATPIEAIIDEDTGRVRRGATAAGDGTVARYSALADERQGNAWRQGLQSPIGWDRVSFYFDDHLGLTKSPEFTDNVLFYLLEEPRD